MSTAPWLPDASLLWVEGDSITGASDGANVTEWPARAGLPLAGAFGAKFIDGGLNGRDGVRFGGGSRLTTLATALNLTGDWAYALVMRTRPGNGNGMAIMWGDTASGQRRALWSAGDAGTVSFSGYDANVQSDATTSSATIVFVKRVAGVITISANGTERASGQPALSGFTYKGLTLGANYDGSEPFTGDIYAAVIGTALDQARVEGYLAHKYGLAGALPVGHAYKSAAPTVTVADPDPDPEPEPEDPDDPELPDPTPIPELPNQLGDALVAFTGCIGGAIGDICSFGLTMGDSYVPFDPDDDECDDEDEKGEMLCSQVWVRVVNIGVKAMPSSFGGNPDCAGITRVIDLEVGVIRCVEIPEDGEAPQTTDVLLAALQSIDDSNALLCAALSCGATEEDCDAGIWDEITIGTWQPFGPMGGQYGGTWSFTVEF